MKNIHKEEDINIDNDTLRNWLKSPQTSWLEHNHLNQREKQFKNEFL